MHQLLQCKSRNHHPKYRKQWKCHFIWEDQLLKNLQLNLFEGLTNLDCSIFHCLLFVNLGKFRTPHHFCHLFILYPKPLFFLSLIQELQISRPIRHPFQLNKLTFPRVFALCTFLYRLCQQNSFLQGQNRIYYYQTVFCQVVIGILQLLQHPLLVFLELIDLVKWHLTLLFS